MDDKRRNRILVYLGIVTLAAVVTAVYVMLNRLSQEVLTVLATIACAAGVSIPSTALLLVLILRRQDQPKDTPQMTQPMMMVVPPMALPQQQPQPESRPAVLSHEDRIRRFTVVGGDDSGYNSSVD